MSGLMFLAMFLSIFALVVGVPRMLIRSRPRPEESVFEGVLDDLEGLDPTGRPKSPPKTPHGR